MVLVAGLTGLGVTLLRGSVLDLSLMLVGVGEDFSLDSMVLFGRTAEAVGVDLVAAIILVGSVEREAVFAWRGAGK